MEQPDRYQPTVGTAELVVDGAKIGGVVAVHRADVVVQESIFFPDDLHVPRSAFARIEEDHLVTSRTVDDVTHQGWDATPPAAYLDDEVAVFSTGERVRPDADEDAGG